MDALDGAPTCVAGYNIKTKMQIVLTCLVPTAIQLLVYITITVVDFGLVVQHFLVKNVLWACLTLSFILAPSLLCFTIIMFSTWPEKSGCSSVNIKFFIRQLLNMIFFPLGAIYRFSRIIFWSIEALFHEKNTYERYHAVKKAAETSPFELYHFLQSFFHAAPQIILQLSLLLRENLFRNYDTTILQVLSVIFSLIKMGMTIESFHRFESQKCVGRDYPWTPIEKVEARRRKLRRTTSAPAASTPRDEIRSKLSDFDQRFTHNFRSSEATKTLNINPNNFDSNVRKSMNDPYFLSNFTDDDKIKNQNQEIKKVVNVNIEQAAPALSYDTVDNDNVNDKAKKTNIKFRNNVPDDDLIEEIDDDVPQLENGNDKKHLRRKSNEMEDNFDESPSLPPPPRPTSSFPYLGTLVRLSTYKDMLIFNTEEFIKDHVPRLPPGLFEHHHHPNDGQINNNGKASEPLNPTPSTSESPQKQDEADFLLPTRKIMINGIEQDDIVSKSVIFAAWVMFITMRMISLSAFAVFYPEACAYLCLTHYLIMLICLFIETKFHEKLIRILFYFILSYIFVFGLMEFKIKFKNVRRWYVSYFIFVFVQNLTITIIWMTTSNIESFWFHFLFNIIIQSGILSAACMIFYFFFLKPKDKVLFVNE